MTLHGGRAMGTVLQVCASTALFVAPLCALGQGGTLWAPLDAANPEHAIILAWHKALVSGDYPAYQRITGGIPGVSDATQRQHFDYVRTMTPPTIVLATNAIRINPNGTRNYTIAGCVKMPGDPQEMRMVNGVTAYQQGGQWRVAGSDFGPPWNNTVRQCPVK